MNAEPIPVASNKKYEMKGASFSDRPAKLAVMEKSEKGTRRVSDVIWRLQVMCPRKSNPGGRGSVRYQRTASILQEW